MDTPDGYGTWLHGLQQAADGGSRVLKGYMRHTSIDMLVCLEESRPGALDRVMERAQRVDAVRAGVEAQ